MRIRLSISPFPRNASVLVAGMGLTDPPCLQLFFVAAAAAAQEPNGDPVRRSAAQPRSRDDAKAHSLKISKRRGPICQGVRAGGVPCAAD